MCLNAAAPGVSHFPQVEAELPHGLKARLAVVEEALVPGHQDDQGPVSCLVLAPLDLGLQVAASLQANGLGNVLRGVDATNSINSISFL